MGSRIYTSVSNGAAKRQKKIEKERRGVANRECSLEVNTENNMYVIVLSPKCRIK
jgi:hypothetical protein